MDLEPARVSVRLISSYTTALKAQFARGECDVILTTEDHTDPEGEVLAEGLPDDVRRNLDVQRVYLGEAA